jgi:hypothetical protein
MWLQVFLLLAYPVSAIPWVDACLMLLTRETGVPGLVVDEACSFVAASTCQHWLLDSLVVDLPMRTLGVVAPAEIFFGFEAPDGLDLLVSVRPNKPVRRTGSSCVLSYLAKSSAKANSAISSDESKP